MFDIAHAQYRHVLRPVAQGVPSMLVSVVAPIRLWRDEGTITEPDAAETFRRAGTHHVEASVGALPR
jgi:hypothetical protein